MANPAISWWNLHLSCCRRRVVVGTDSRTEIHRAAPSPFLLFIAIPCQRRVPPSLFPPLSPWLLRREIACVITEDMKAWKHSGRVSDNLTAGDPWTALRYRVDRWKWHTPNWECVLYSAYRTQTYTVYARWFTESLIAHVICDVFTWGWWNVSLHVLSGNVDSLCVLRWELNSVCSYVSGEGECFGCSWCVCTWDLSFLS